MATYRNVQLSFWTDSKVTDDFTPEDKYFYLYLLSNPHTNTCGCYEISMKQMSIETGYSQETIDRLIERFALVHDIVRYSKDNKEMLLINWYKYNWTKSEKLRTSILNGIKAIKTKTFKKYLTARFEGYDPDTTDETAQVNNEDEEIVIPSNEEVAEDENVSSPPVRKKKPKAVKHAYGEYKHVKLSDDEYARLCRDYGEEATLLGIKKVDEYCQRSGRRYQDYNLTIRNWGMDSPKLDKDSRKETSDNGQVRRTLQ